MNDSNATNAAEHQDDRPVATESAGEENPNDADHTANSDASTLETTNGSSAKKVEFANLTASAPKPRDENFGRVMDIPVPLCVELGRAEMKIADVLQFGPGLVITLNKMAGDPVDIVVKGQLIAQGEVVVVDECFGVRITDIVAKGDRIRGLN